MCGRSALGQRCRATGPRVWTAGVLLAAAVAGAVAAAYAAPAAPAKKDESSFQTSVPAAILIDPDSDSVLFEKNGDEPVAPASLAKLMTLEFVFNEIKQGRIKLDDEFTISENAWRKGGAPSHGSTMYAAIHSKVSLDDLIHGIIVDSANDACIAIAEGLAGNESAFGANADQARARDRARTFDISPMPPATPIPVCASRCATWRSSRATSCKPIPIFIRISPSANSPGTRSGSRTAIRCWAWASAPTGLRPAKPPKPASTWSARRLPTDLRLIVVVTGAKSDKERAEEARKLLELGLPRLRSPGVVRRRPDHRRRQGVWRRHAATFRWSGRAPSGVMMPRNTSERLFARIVYTGPVPAPVSKGQLIGKLKVWRGENLALEVPLTAAEDVGKGTMSQRAMDGATELMIGLFRAGVDRL